MIKKINLSLENFLCPVLTTLAEEFPGESTDSMICGSREDLRSLAVRVALSALQLLLDAVCNLGWLRFSNLHAGALSRETYAYIHIYIYIYS